MNAPHKITPPEYRYRAETCGTCDGRYGECYDCGGEGAWTASCADCGEEKPLNDNGVCEQCQAENEWLPTANLFGTVCLPDPLLKRRAI